MGLLIELEKEEKETDNDNKSDLVEKWGGEEVRGEGLYKSTYQPEKKCNISQNFSTLLWIILPPHLLTSSPSL